MGLLDKVSTFVGGKGMATVTITVIEKQPADNATFPVKDTVIKGTMVIEAQKDCTLLATKYEVYLYIKGDVGESTGTPNLVVAALDPDPDTTYDDSSLKFPHDMKAGETIEQPFLVGDVNLPPVLEKAGYMDPRDAVGDPRVALVVKCIADVKGSPFDPFAEATITITE